MEFGTKLLLTSIIFFIIGGIIGGVSQNEDHEPGVALGMTIIIISIVAFIVSLLILIWW